MILIVCRIIVCTTAIILGGGDNMDILYVFGSNVKNYRTYIII